MGNPEATSALSAALAPGMGITATPAAMAWAASQLPGSLMPGIPASETTAMRPPALSASIKFSRALVLVVLVAAYGGSGDLKMVEQLLRLAGVFAGDAVHASQHVQGAQGNVAQVADGSGHEIEARGKRRFRFGGHWARSISGFLAGF